MRLVHARDGSWALLDERHGVARQIAGRLTAWAPRLAGGEGMWALPLTGRSEPDERRTALDPTAFGRMAVIHQIGKVRSGVAAVIGASLVGRRNSFRSVCGYVGVRSRGGSWCLGPALVTRDEIGDEPPALVDAESFASSPANYLLQVDRERALASGDLVLLGELDPTSNFSQRLWRLSSPDRCDHAAHQLLDHWANGARSVQQSSAAKTAYAPSITIDEGPHRPRQHVG